jgi:ATP-dependent Clp protease ATP-binding subunit ClpC
MGSRFERFSDRARRVLALAQEETHSRNHHYIGTEHILLGLVRESEGVAARVLSGLGVGLGEVRSGVEFIISRGEQPAEGEVGLTPRAKRVVELAVDEARRMNHTHIGTEHLLIGLLREGEGVAAGVLESLGVKLEEVRSETHSILSSGAHSESPGHRDVASAHLLGPARPGGGLEELLPRLIRVDRRLADLEKLLNSRFDALESRVAKLEQLLQNG